MEQCHDCHDTQGTFIDVAENVLGVVDNVVEVVENALGSWNTSRVVGNVLGVVGAS